MQFLDKASRDLIDCVQRLSTPHLHAACNEPHAVLARDHVTALDEILRIGGPK
jgi:hypothetical protein